MIVRLLNRILGRIACRYFGHFWRYEYIGSRKDVCSIVKAADRINGKPMNKRTCWLCDRNEYLFPTYIPFVHSNATWMTNMDYAEWRFRHRMAM